MGVRANRPGADKGGVGWRHQNMVILRRRHRPVAGFDVAGKNWLKLFQPPGAVMYSPML